VYDALICVDIVKTKSTPQEHNILLLLIRPPCTPRQTARLHYDVCRLQLLYDDVNGLRTMG